MRGLTKALVVAAIPLSAANAQSGPPMLQPTSDWVLDYAEDSCALRRAFGESDRAVVLEMRAFGVGNGMQVRLYGEKPALDGNGDPIRSVWGTYVRYRMGG